VQSQGADANRVLTKMVDPEAESLQAALQQARLETVIAAAIAAGVTGLIEF
jgi:hypothetical protein